MNDGVKRHSDVCQSIADQKAELKRVWELFRPENIQLFELRAIDPSSAMRTRIEHFRATKYDCLASLQGAFENRALELNQAGYNIYSTLNQLNPTSAAQLQKMPTYCVDACSLLTSIGWEIQSSRRQMMRSPEH